MTFRRSVKPARRENRRPEARFDTPYLSIAHLPTKDTSKNYMSAFGATADRAPLTSNRQRTHALLARARWLLPSDTGP